MAEDELICPSCGNLREICSDPEQPWYPQRDVCHATGAREWLSRRISAKNKAEDRHKFIDKPHPLDGVALWVSQYDLDPDGDWDRVRPGD